MMTVIHQIDVDSVLKNILALALICQKIWPILPPYLSLQIHVRPNLDYLPYHEQQNHVQRAKKNGILADIAQVPLLSLLGIILRFEMKIEAVLFLWLACHSLALEYRTHDGYRKFSRIDLEGPGTLPAALITLGIMVLLIIGVYCLWKRQNAQTTVNQANPQPQQPQNPINTNGQGTNPPFSAALPQFQQNFNSPNPNSFNNYNQPMNPYIVNPTERQQRF